MPIDLPRLAEWAVCLTVPARWPHQADQVRRQFRRRGIDVSLFLNGPEADPSSDVEAGDLVMHFDELPPPGWKGHAPSWSQWNAIKAIVATAQASGYRSILLVEDDCLLIPEFDRVIGEAEVPPDWDAVYLGSQNGRDTTERLSPNLLRCRGGTLATHCVLIRETIYQAILDLPPNQPIDCGISDRIQPRGRCYAVWPSVAIQLPGLSTITGEIGGWPFLYDKSGVPGEDRDR